MPEPARIALRLYSSAEALAVIAVTRACDPGNIAGGSFFKYRRHPAWSSRPEGVNKNRGRATAAHNRWSVVLHVMAVTRSSDLQHRDSLGNFVP